jgi:hypothetical protein
MLFSLVMVVILSFSVSVILYLFLAKNGSNNREFFNTKFDENEVNDELIKINNMKSDIVRVSKSMETKSTELKEIKIEKNKLIEKLEIAKKVADKRKVDQKILSITTPAGELPSNPVIAKTEIKHLVETVDDNLKKMADAKKFDEKMLKNSAIGLNEELKKFISNKEKEALNNPYFKATYGRDWVAFVNDLKNKGKESVFSGLDIKNVKDKPNSLKGMESLKNLLLQTKVEELNYYFAFDYFKEHFTNNEVNRKKLLNELFNLPNVTTMARQVPIPPQEMDKEKIKKIQTANEDEVKQRNLKIENKVTEYLGYLKKYEDFYNKLNADNK